MNTACSPVDVLVIGGGTAALRAGVAAAEAGCSVAIIQKGAPGLGIVGFNAPVPDQGDSPPKFFNDVYIAGEFISNPQLVSLLTEHALEEVHVLEQSGINFQHERGYEPHLTSGNQTPRTIYTTDRTGPDIISLLQTQLKKLHVLIHKRRQAIVLLHSEDRVCGATVYNERVQEFEAYFARAVIIATGGIGPLYSLSTNPTDLSADGFACAYRAGVELIDMEFIQFEPFVLLTSANSKGFSTSFLLDNKPKIYNSKGEEFLPNGGSGIGKDRLARLITEQVRIGKGSPLGGIFFDLRHIPIKQYQEHRRFLAICRRAKIDPAQVPLEVGPSQHYVMGGVRIDTKGSTSLPGLFAAGEVTGGVHGASRLAGNSGTDVLVFGAIAGRSAAEYAKEQKLQILNEIEISDQMNVALKPIGVGSIDFLETIRQRQMLRKIMWDYVGIERNQEGLELALDCLTKLKEQVNATRVQNIVEQVQLHELENFIITGEMICNAALYREESRGAHYRSDFPSRNDRLWLKNIAFTYKDGKLQVRFLSPRLDVIGERIINVA